ncbi:MAG: ribonuclease P protein component [Rhodospirillales bacterium]|nr:ribonuclease P protein component [Rhodospirillales bacterium]MCB9965684.1 ribonuclease P protein component [Rhodospirillales bacterium]
MHTPSNQSHLLGRLKQRPEFLRVAQEQRRWTATGLSVQIAPNARDTSRFGLTITKKIYKEAVKRNRIRRRLRALAYEVLSEFLPQGYDIVLIGRAETLERPYDDLKKDLLWCLKRLGV